MKPKTIIMTIKNLTPHPVVILNGRYREIRTFLPDGLVRLKTTTISVGEIDGVAITSTVFGEPEGLPEYSEEVFYIVSQLVKSALPNRTDLLVPAEVHRDGNGVIVGCKSLGV